MPKTITPPAVQSYLASPHLNLRISEPPNFPFQKSEKRVVRRDGERLSACISQREGVKTGREQKLPFVFSEKKSIRNPLSLLHSPCRSVV